MIYAFLLAAAAPVAPVTIVTVQAPVSVVKTEWVIETVNDSVSDDQRSFDTRAAFLADAARRADALDIKYPGNGYAIAVRRRDFGAISTSGPDYSVTKIQPNPNVRAYLMIWIKRAP